MAIAFVFPGQGSQVVGMGRDLYESSPAARAIFDQADATLRFALSRLCFAGPDETLTSTENAQPALLTTCVALLAALAERYGDIETRRHGDRGPVSWSPRLRVSVSHVAGHSLGEYSALVAAGALDFPTALRLVRRRGELMAAAHEGGMAAIIGMDAEPLEEICRAVSAEGRPVVIANYNSPGQFVISGSATAVARASAQAKGHGARRALPLKVSAAFHSPLMHAAADGLAAAVARASVVDARVPVISNVTAEPLVEAAAIRRELVAQVTAPVRWIESVERMIAAGVDTFVEAGPGAVLTGLIKRITPDARLVNVSDLASAHAFFEHSGARSQESGVRIARHILTPDS
ncbi:MAG TPA: ACP S-malonyltransferase [Roseiflexaceae bacterium]